MIDPGLQGSEGEPEEVDGTGLRVRLLLMLN